jgi:hypothetical protein
VLGRRDLPGDVDQTLRTGPSASLARDFLIWASSRGHAQRLDIPIPERPTGASISQDQRWAHAARLLHEDAPDPTDRVAGCLLLLYGQPRACVLEHGSKRCRWR